jgi:hypothetical protein
MILSSFKVAGLKLTTHVQGLAVISSGLDNLMRRSSHEPPRPKPFLSGVFDGGFVMIFIEKKQLKEAF